jgi:hypothetical protein
MMPLYSRPQGWQPSASSPTQNLPILPPFSKGRMLAKNVINAFFEGFDDEIAEENAGDSNFEVTITKLCFFDFYN